MDDSDDAGTEGDSANVVAEHPVDRPDDWEGDVPPVPGPVELGEGTGTGHLMTRKEELSTPIQTEQVVKPNVDYIRLQRRVRLQKQKIIYHERYISDMSDDESMVLNSISSIPVLY